VLVVRAELSPGRRQDVRVEGGSITDVADRLAPARDEEVIDARGNAVLPGLHDHHIHLRAAAAATGSVDLRGINDEPSVARALHQVGARRGPHEWIRAVGYHESIAGELDRRALDRLAPPATPVRVQHRTGALWILNSAAVAALGLRDAEEPGVDVEKGWLLRRDDLLRPFSELDARQLRSFGRKAAASGVTGFTDATPDGTSNHARDLARDLRAAGVQQELYLMGPVDATAPDAERSRLGPVKVLLDDHDLPALDALATVVRDAHERGRRVAIHCVTRVQLVLAVAALESVGARQGDRIEHGSVIPAELFGTLVRLGVTVVTQPHFVVERGDDYVRDVDEDDLTSLYRLRSLLDARVAVAGGTDAPFGSADPWTSIAAASRRRTARGTPLGEAEEVDLTTAIGLYLGRADEPQRLRSITAGATADLCVLDVPWHVLEDSLPDVQVRATIIDGKVAYSSEDPHRDDVPV
jgi:predicted amidohydrolase YtcJ